MILAMEREEEWIRGCIEVEEKLAMYRFIKKDMSYAEQLAQVLS